VASQSHARPQLFKEPIMSNVRVALYVVALLATYALAAKLDEPEGSPADRTARQSPAAGC